MGETRHGRQSEGRFLLKSGRLKLGFSNKIIAGVAES
jgi:hypothetical protein